MTADEIIEQIKNANHLEYEEILALYHEMCNFMKSDAPEEEKNKFRGIGYGEMLGMMVADEDRL